MLGAPAMLPSVPPLIPYATMYENSVARANAVALLMALTKRGLLPAQRRL